MPRTRRIYPATHATVDRANALSRPILVGLLASVWPTLIHVPAVLAEPTNVRDFLALRGAMPNADDREASVEAHAKRLLIRFKPGTSRALEHELHARARVDRVLRRFRSVEGLCLVQVAEGRRTSAMAVYAAEPRVQYVQRDHVIHAAAVPDDPLFDQQWGLQNTGQTIDDNGADPGTVGADIRAADAWNLTTGNAAFRIAVLDSGVDYLHPDLAGNIWTNPGEIPGNGVDDDGNGWIDDIHGYDTVNEDGDPMDDWFHGTHVAGTLGAIGNNGIGVAGVNWQCQIVALKILDSNGLGFESDAIEAIDYLIDNGILLSNNSWTAGGEFSPALSDAVGGLQSIGHLFVAAAGSLFGRNIDEVPVYPASFDFPHMIVVAAVDNDDILSAFSNIGPISVDVGAPGVSVLSTLPAGMYGFMSGTSAATPLVTGTVALLWGRRPDLGWSDVRSRILRSVRPVPTLIGRTVTGGVIDAGVAVGDCNHNGVADEQDIAQGGSDDCNGDGFPDECEPDCNGTGLADACDIATSVSEDCNGNSIPDECDLAADSSEDCNGNAVPDECDLISGGSEDLNGTGVPDECEACSVATDCDDGNFCTEGTCSASLCSKSERTGPCDDGDACTFDDACQSGVCVGTPVADSECAPVLSMTAVAINGTPISDGPVSEVTVRQGDRLTVELLVRNWSPRRLLAYNLVIDPSGYTSGATGSLNPVVDPTPDAGAFVEVERFDFLFSGRTSFTLVSNSDLSFYQYGSTTLFDEDCAADAGESAYLGTLVLDIAETASGAFQMCLEEDIINLSSLLDCPSLIHIAPILFECLTIDTPLNDCTPGEDCNGNGVWDICDVSHGTSADCNGNDVPDECDIAEGSSQDCNGNDVPDECDIAEGSSQDCDGNGLPDECDPFEDCNENAIQDICDIAAGTSNDCNENRRPDECELFFVNVQATGADDGTSWEDAFVDLQQALAAASETCGVGPQVWVAAGTYRPDAFAGDRAATFQLAPHVRIYGGFAGGESSIEQRDAIQNLTILSGDLNGDDDSPLIGIDDNSFHVVTGSGASAAALLDGFMITAGKANGSEASDSTGAGMIISPGSPTIRNCVFFGNRAAGDGGAVLLGSGSAALVNCIFSGNRAGGQGGAVRHLAGIHTMTNCTIVDNVAINGGGGIFSGNPLPLGGDTARIPSLVILRNSILYGNRDGSGSMTEDAQIVAFTPSVRFCCIQGLTGFQFGPGNIGDDPSFVDADGPDDEPGTIDDNLRLSEGSPCIDRGDNNAPLLPPTDWEGDPRVQHCRVDIGVDETPFLQDCNDNGEADTCEIESGQVQDCDDNLIPDDCDPDCNENGRPDACDLAQGTSFDCFGNGVPDECERDCNENGTPDNCDIADGTSIDCNGNGVPDTCDIAGGVSQDCDGDGEPDDCLDTVPISESSPQLSPIGFESPQQYEFTSLLRSVGTVRITLFASADLSGQEKFLSVFVNGTFVGEGFKSSGGQCATAFNSSDIFLTARDFNMLALDGTAVFDIVASEAVDRAACSDESNVFVQLRYTGANPRDCDRNLIPDVCEPDSDGDGAIDNCDECPDLPTEQFEGVCGCGEPVFDSDGDSVPDCLDVCPLQDDTIDEDLDGVPDCRSTIPATSTWGVIVLALLLMTAAKVYFGFRATQTGYRDSAKSS